ncbi:MAG: hypothetical protein C0510_11075 [Erythrobacter sp.]|nr:hypothetical protein [Erythrobacter sp.]
MNAETSPNLPYNGAMFRWAREWRGKSLEDAARRLQTNAENITAWEQGDGAPTVRQARMLAEFYDRSFLEFFLDQPPNLNEPEMVRDFRLHRGAEDPYEKREIWHIQRWAETQRLNALDLFDLIGEEPPTFPQNLVATLKTSPDLIAQLVRKEAGFAIRQQMDLTGNDRNKLPSLIRTAFEALGVLVLRRTDLGIHEIRGITIAEFPLPTVVFGKETPTAQSFTLAHELGHILLKQSGISGPPSAENSATEAKAIERWCDQFAGAFLIPATAMAERWAKPNEPMPRVGDDTLNSLAKAFRVSRHAMLIRLVDLGYVEGGFYWKVKRPEFLAAEAEVKKGGGIPAYYGRRYINSHGNLYTGLVLEAMSRGVITNDRAANFMGIKNLAHLDDIRREFRA